MGTIVKAFLVYGIEIFDPNNPRYGELPPWGEEEPEEYLNSIGIRTWHRAELGQACLTLLKTGYHGYSGAVLCANGSKRYSVEWAETQTIPYNLSKYVKTETQRLLREAAHKLNLDREPGWLLCCNER
jgi:hypothetical protein